MLDEIKEVIKFKHMLYYLSRSEIRNKYRGSILGVMWSFITPTFMLVIYGFVFSIIMKIKIEDYFIFLFCGYWPWVYLRTSILTSTNAILGNSSLVKKIYFPRLVLPLSIVIGNTFSFFIGLVFVLMPSIILFHNQLGWSLLSLPLIVLIQVMLITGCSIIVSAISVLFRDLRQVLEIFFTGFFYLTPIIYTIDMVPQKFRVFIDNNPLAALIDGYRNVLFFGTNPPMLKLCILGLVSVAGLFIALWVFSRINKTFAERI